VLHELVETGNTVVVIEHNLEVIKTADWVIDLGPEGGDGGGEIVATGTPEDITESPRSHTGRFLKEIMARRTRQLGTAETRQTMVVSTYRRIIFNIVSLMVPAIGLSAPASGRGRNRRPVSYSVCRISTEPGTVPATL